MVVIEDVLTFAQEKRIRVVEVKALGTRRGPASEAQELYIDRSSVEELFPKAHVCRPKHQPHPHVPHFDRPTRHAESESEAGAERAGRQAGAR